MTNTCSTPISKQRLKRRCARAVQTMRIKLMLRRMDEEQEAKRVQAV